MIWVIVLYRDPVDNLTIPYKKYSQSFILPPLLLLQLFSNTLYADKDLLDNVENALETYDLQRVKEYVAKTQKHVSHSLSFLFTILHIIP